MRKIFFILLLLALTIPIIAQTTVRQKDQWGAKLYYIDNQTIRQKDQWGEKLVCFSCISMAIKSDRKTSGEQCCITLMDSISD